MRCFVFLSVLFLASPALAAERSVAVRWSAPKECPSSAELASRTAARIPEDQSIRAEGRVTKTGAKYKLLLEVDGKGERALEADTCDALATSAAVVLAMSVAPPRVDAKDEKANKADATEKTPEPEPSAANDAPVAAAEAARTEERAAPPPASRSTRVTLRPEVVGDGGTLPAFGVGGGLAVGLDLGRAHVEAFGAIFGSTDGTSNDAAKGASFGLVGGGARGCYAIVTSPIVFAPCAGLRIAHLSATGFGAKSVGSGEATLVGPEGAITLAVPISGAVRVRAVGSAFAPIQRRSFVITAVGEVHEPSAVAFGAALGPEVLF